MQTLTSWLNKIVKSVIALLACLSITKVNAQAIKTLSLQDAYRLYQQHYPLIRQRGLLQQIEALTMQNLRTGYLPQISLNGQATYQSDVTKVDIPIPSIKTPTQSKDQYKATADVSQIIWDGGLIRQQEKLQELNTNVEESKVEVELYTLKDRVNQLFLGILYHEKLLQQSALVEKDLQLAINKVKPQVQNGTMLRSNLQTLDAQLLQTKQRSIEIRSSRQGLIDALSLLINQSLSEATVFEEPTISTVLETSIIRPELKLYNAQIQTLKGQYKLIDIRNCPKASWFVQGGYGRPGLNMLSNKFDAYYIGGIRFNWSLGGMYTRKQEKKILDINKQTVELQKETFLLNTNSKLIQQKREVLKYTELVNTDKEIISLRRSIKEAANAQLDNAVITVNDYLREVTAEDNARQAQALHQIQLLQAIINYNTITGKQ